MTQKELDEINKGNSWKLVVPVDTPENVAAGDGSLDPLDGLLRLQHDCNAALTCLYLAVDERIAKDVNDKVRAYIKALETPKQPIDGRGATDAR